MADDTVRTWIRRDPEKYHPCAWSMCVNEASDRYPELPLCQHHALYVWSIVDQDIRESGKTAADLLRDEAARQEAQIEQNRQRAIAARRRNGQDGFVYYLEVGGMIKIGFTRNTLRRGREYPPSAELLAMHYGTPADERKLHQRFAAYRESGREWYLDCQEIRDHIAKLNDAPGAWRQGMSRRRRGDQATRSPRKPTRVVLR